MKPKSLWMTTLATLFLAAFISGCKKDDLDVPDGVRPIVISTDPC